MLAPAASCSFTFSARSPATPATARPTSSPRAARTTRTTRATAEDDAIVTLNDVAPSITVDKSASPLSLPEPGGFFTFTVTVTNNSRVEAVTITSLEDDVYGTLAGDLDCEVGTVLALGAESCTFDFTGAFTGNAGDSQTDTVTVCVTTTTATTCDADDATVTIADVAPIDHRRQVRQPEVDRRAGWQLHLHGNGHQQQRRVGHHHQARRQHLRHARRRRRLRGRHGSRRGEVCTFDFIGEVTGNAGRPTPTSSRSAPRTTMGPRTATTTTRR